MSSTAQIIKFNAATESHPTNERGKGAQLEDGFTRIANELLDAIMKAPLTSREARVLRAVERATFGWGRKSKWLAASVLGEMTGMTRQNASRALNSLLRKRVLIREGGSRSPVHINTKVNEWDFNSETERVSPKNTTESKQAHLAQNRLTELAQNRLTNKESKEIDISKDISVKKKITRPDAAVQTPNGKSWGTQQDLEIARMMANDIAKLAGGTESNKTDQQLCNWANDIRLLRSKKTNSGKTITHDHIKTLWQYANHDSFWCTNILSPKKLSKQWETLAIKRTQENKSGAASHAKHQSNYIMSAQEAAEFIAAEQREQQFGECSGNTYEHEDGC